MTFNVHLKDNHKVKRTSCLFVSLSAWFGCSLFLCFIGLSVIRSVCRSVCLSVGRSIGQSVGRSVGQSVGRFVCLFISLFIP